MRRDGPWPWTSRSSRKGVYPPEPEIKVGALDPRGGRRLHQRLVGADPDYNSIVAFYPSASAGVRIS